MKDSILDDQWEKTATQMKSAIRCHDNVFLYQRDAVEYVIKKISRTEAEVLEYLRPLPSVLQPVELRACERFYWAAFPKLEGVLWGQHAEQIYRTTIHQLAQFHDFTQKTRSKLSFKALDYPQELSQMKQLAIANNIPLSPDIFETVSDLVDIPDEERFLIHDDFLPFNVVVNREKEPFFIDFSECRFDFGERDIGRFLADINPFEGTMDFQNKRYYPYKFYSMIKEAYLQERHFCNPQYDIVAGRRRLLLGEIWNHFNVIKACVLTKDTSSEWINLNIDAVRRLVDATPSLLSPVAIRDGAGAY